MMRILFFIFLALNLSFSSSIKGSGGTLVEGVMGELISSYYKASNKKVEYLSIGSSGGLKQLENSNFDFAITEIKPSDENMKNLQKELFVQGCVVLAYNVEGIKDLVLSGDVIAKIYLGKITKWNDKEILALNNEISLPNEDIKLFHRYDGSGTTLAFSEYLSNSNFKWQEIYASKEYINFKFGTGKRGNSEISKSIQETPNSLGYINYASAKELNLNYVSLKENSQIISAKDMNYPVKIQSYIIYKSDSKKRVIIENFIKFIKNDGKDIIIKNSLIP